MRLEKLVEKLDAAWIDDQKSLEEQTEVVLSILRMGAYSMPMKVLGCDIVNVHVQDTLRKDLIKCLGNIRQGKILENYYIRFI